MAAQITLKRDGECKECKRVLPAGTPKVRYYGRSGMYCPKAMGHIGADGPDTIAEKKGER